MRMEVGRENGDAIELFCEDRGRGTPVVLVHGWPLPSSCWDKQVGVLVDAGYRVVTYDRRGSGRSSSPSFGYDYDTMADDLAHLLARLDLQSCMLVGFSTGCGDIVRYMGTYGAERVERVALIAPLPPAGLCAERELAQHVDCLFNAVAQRLSDDRPAFLWEFLAKSHGRDGTPIDHSISEAALRAQWTQALAGSHHAALASVATWRTDLRDDLARIGVPVLLLHGGADTVLPQELTSQPMAAALEDSRLAVMDGAPHGLLWTHADAVATELLGFFQE